MVAAVVATLQIDTIGIRKREAESIRIVKELTCVDWMCLKGWSSKVILYWHDARQSVIR
jgi:hypothetical protein